MAFHMGVDADHVFDFALLGACGNKTRVQIGGEHKVGMALNSGVEELQGNGERVIFDQDVALQFARVQHKLAGFLHSTITDPILLQRSLCFDGIVGTGNKQLDQRPIGIFVGYYPTTKHIRVDI